MTTVRPCSLGPRWPAFVLFWVVYAAAVGVVISPDSLRAVAQKESNYHKTVQLIQGGP